MRKRRKEKLNRKQKRIKHRATIRTILLLIITLIFNTYAWFVYLTTVTANMTAHVEAWHVEFTVSGETVSREFPISIAHAYPGMEDEEETVEVLNDGDKTADVGYAIKTMRIFNTVYAATDQFGSNETIPQGAIQSTSSQLLNKIQNDYPFSLDITINNSTIQPEQRSSLTFTFSWDYESGDDETDTDYGTGAYTYYQTNPTGQPIEIVIKLIVTQHQQQNQNQNSDPSPALDPDPNQG